MFKRRKIFMPADAPFAQWLIRELLTFPNALGDGVDDGVDALSLLGRRLVAVASASAKVVPIKRPEGQYCLEDLWSTAPNLNSRRI
jgi:phage terminase large subunit-like protein